jgi:hypothetical protein
LVLAKALTRISEFNLQPSTPALAFAGRRNQMLKRIKRIVQRQPQTNWLSGLLSFSLLLLSFFLMSTNTGMNDNLNLEEKAKDPIEVQKVQFQDTAKINKAILEILKPNSRISIRPNENGGRPLIFLDKEEITGEEYAIYLAAYDQIQDFRHEVSSEYSGILKFSLKDNLDSSKFRLPTEEEWKSKIDSARSEYDLIEYKNWIKGTYNIIEIDLDSISINNGILESALKGTGLRVERLNKKDSDFTAEIMFNGEVDTNNNKILFEKNGEILNGDSSIKQLDPNLIQKISVIKNKSEIAQLSLDTTLVEGIIRIVTKPNVDWKAATNSSSPRVRLRGITVITVKDEKSDQERIRDREPIKVPVEVNGVRGASLEDINPADIKSLSVIKNDAELHERNYDTTLVEGIILIETLKGSKASKKTKESETKLSLQRAGDPSGVDKNGPPRFKFAISDSEDRPLIYEVDHKIISYEEFLEMDESLIKAIEFVSNQSTIRALYPNLKGENLSLVRVSTKKQHGLQPNAIMEKHPYTSTAFTKDFLEIEFGDVLSEKEQLDFSIQKLKDLKPMIEFNGELKPDWTFENLYNLGTNHIEKIVVAKGDKMYDFYKKRELRGRDALLKIITK